jgi:3-oxoacyl-[acyl-carrier-protein] synthase II
MRRVVITGVGLVTGLGIGTEPTWKALTAGRSAIGRLSLFDPSSLATQIGAEIVDFDPKAFADRRTLRMMTRNDQLALAGATTAIQDSGFELAGEDADRLAVFAGGNKEISNPMSLLSGAIAARTDDGTASYRKLGEEAVSSFHPLFFVEGLQAASLFYISSAFGLRGVNTYFAGTADAGATAIGRGYRAVRRGEADMAVAGGFDDAVSWWTMSKMDTLGVLSTRNDLGAAACRPYDAERSGSVLGEGAAFCILEELESARRRGAEVYAEVTGFGSGFDAYRTVTPHPQGRGLVVALRRAMEEAAIAPEDLGYIATHGCATHLGDPSEVVALRTALGTAAEHVPASSVKPAAGHLVAGAGALNVAVAALAVRHGVLPPTLNLDDPDPDCRLDWVVDEAREQRVDHALALARGLEGQNVALALGAVA